MSKGGDRKAGWQPEIMTPGQAGVLKGRQVELAETLSMTSWVSLYYTLQVCVQSPISFFSVFYLSVSCLYSSLSVSVVICHCVSLPWDNRHTFLVLGLMCSLISLQTIVGERPKGP